MWTLCCFGLWLEILNHHWLGHIANLWALRLNPARGLSFHDQDRALTTAHHPPWWMGSKYIWRYWCRHHTRLLTLALGAWPCLATKVSTAGNLPGPHPTLQCWASIPIPCLWVAFLVLISEHSNCPDVPVSFTARSSGRQQRQHSPPQPWHLAPGRHIRCIYYSMSTQQSQLPPVVAQILISLSVQHLKSCVFVYERWTFSLYCFIVLSPHPIHCIMNVFLSP